VIIIEKYRYHGRGTTTCRLRSNLYRQCRTSLNKECLGTTPFPCTLLQTCDNSESSVCLILGSSWKMCEKSIIKLRRGRRFRWIKRARRRVSKYVLGTAYALYLKCHNHCCHTVVQCAYLLQLTDSRTLRILFLIYS
jgi:hypothetical protein